MNTLEKLIICGLAVILFNGCSGIRTTDRSFSVHAENFNIFYMQFPGGDTHERALDMLPEGAIVDTFYSTPHDNTSFFGVLSRIIGMEHTTITGRLESNALGPVTSQP